MHDWAIKVPLLLSFSGVLYVPLWGLQHISIWPLCHWIHQGGKNISSQHLYLFQMHLPWMLKFVYRMIKCCALVCWDHGLFVGAACKGSQGWVLSDSGSYGERVWEGSEMQLRTWGLICINAFSMNSTESCTNYRIASACHQGHREISGKKEQRSASDWLQGVYSNFFNVFFC